jgi:hypothetical protein
MPAKQKGKPKRQRKPKVYAPKVSIPLSFDKAVEGLLAVKPDKKPERPKKGSG